MLQVTDEQLMAWLSTFFFPFCRIGAFFVAAPLMGHNAIPNRVKIGVAVLLSVLIGPLIAPLPAVTIFSYAGMALIVQQLLIGMAIGLTLRICLTAIQATGEYISMQMGLGFAVIYSPDTGSSNAMLARYLHMISLMFFLAINGHLYVFEILLGTFQSLPIGHVELNPEAWKMLASYGSTIFSAGMLLALPLLTSLLLMNLAMGVLNRSAPQLTIFSIGFPLTLLAGLVLLMQMMRTMGPFLERHFAGAMVFLADLVSMIGAQP
jgi:flagellar biosynthetic protein FliR